MLGDVGGFIDITYYIAVVILYLVTFDPLDMMLVQRLYEY